MKLVAEAASPSPSTTVDPQLIDLASFDIR
jgi:hypothetical protein